MVADDNDGRGGEDEVGVNGDGDSDDADGVETDRTYPTSFGLYHPVYRTPDMYQLYLKSGDRETYTELCYGCGPEFLGRAPPEYEDVAFEDWLSVLKTVKLPEDWAGEVDEDRITERYGAGPGDVREKVEASEWPLGVAERLATELDLDSVYAVREAKKCVEYGIYEELPGLAGARGVGQKCAHRLFEASVEARVDPHEADKPCVFAALRGHRKTAENILETAGKKDPSVDVVDEDDVPDDAVPDDVGLETAKECVNQQASLGDSE